eukprot:scaffold5169_cov172-Amphora_coffeaeformis.AAC.14
MHVERLHQLSSERGVHFLDARQHDFIFLRCTNRNTQAFVTVIFIAPESHHDTTICHGFVNFQGFVRQARQQKVGIRRKDFHDELEFVQLGRHHGSFLQCCFDVIVQDVNIIKG